MAELYLDGRALSGRILPEIVYTFSDSNVHNSVSFSSIDVSLFDLCDPDYLHGTERLLAVIGSRSIPFILDARDGERNQFSVTGVSPSVLYDEGYSGEISYQLSAPKLASEIAQELCNATWQADDWVVPTSFNFTGVPLDGLQILTSAIGAIARCNDSGEIIVRKKKLIRPVDLEIANVDVEYYNDVIIALSPQSEPASGYNAVEVIGTQSEVLLPELELEEKADGTALQQGDTAIVRVFWNAVTPNVNSTYVSDGEITIIGNGTFFTEVKEERLVFQNGTASTNYRIEELISYEWIGDNKGEISFSGKELTIADEGFGIADVKFQIMFQRYQVALSNVPMLIAVLYLNYGQDIKIQVCTSDEPVFGPGISSELLSSEFIAAVCGTAWIDENKYKKEKLSIEVPYDDDALDGKIAYINDPLVPVQGNYYITGAGVKITGPKIVNILELEKCIWI